MAQYFGYMMIAMCSIAVVYSVVEPFFKKKKI